MERAIVIVGASLASARGVGSIIQWMWNEPSRLTLYCEPLAETTVRVRWPEAAGPSGCKPPEEPFTSYVHESPGAQVGTSTAAGCGPVPLPGRFGFDPGVPGPRRACGAKASAARQPPASRACA